MGEAKKHAVAIALVVALAAAIATFDRGPFEDGLRGSCGAFFSLMAQNHLRHGFTETLGIPLLNLETTTRDRFVYYRHHPPLIPAGLALVFAATGVSEAAARGAALALHLLTLYVLTVLVARLLGTPIALLALLATALTPYSTYYGPFMNYEVPCLAMLVCTTALVWSTERRWQRLGLASLVIGGLCDWPIFLATPFLAARLWRRSRPLSIAYLATPLLITTLCFAWQLVQQARGGRFPENLGLASYLTQTSPLAIKNWGGWLGAQLRFAWQLGSVPLLLAAASLPLAIARLARSQAGDLDRISLLFFATAVLNVFLFAGRSLDHDYYSLYLLPWVFTGLALLGQAAMEWLGLRFSRRASTSVVAMALVASGALAVQSSIVRYQARAYQGHRTALALREITKAGDAVFLVTGYDLQVPYYAERNVFAAASAAELTHWRTMFGLGERRTLIVVPRGQPLPDWVETLGGQPAAWQSWGDFQVWVLQKEL